MSAILPLPPGDAPLGGLFCECYPHPTRPTVLVKLARDFPKAKRRMRQDVGYYRKYQKGGRTLGHVARYLGKIDTNKGIGHQFELIKDHDGEISKTLHHHLEQKLITLKEAEALAEEAFQSFEADDILVTDLRQHNFLVQDGGDLKKLWLVDGLGDHVAIPILNTLPAERRRKRARRKASFFEGLRREWG